jgi:hypothetical protein
MNMSVRFAATRMAVCIADAPRSTGRWRPRSISPKTRAAKGLGRRLYTELIATLKRQGFRSAFAGIALPNPASVALHESIGFTSFGYFLPWVSSWAGGATSGGGGSVLTRAASLCQAQSRSLSSFDSVITRNAEPNL